MKTYRSALLVAAALFAVSFNAPVHAEDAAPAAATEAAAPSKNIVESASDSKDHTTFVAAVKAADLTATLSGAGPLTVFAPTNDAFAKLPAGAMDTLLKPESKGKLASILTYHVVNGKMTSADLDAKAKENGGKAVLKTVEGEDLTATKDADGKWTIEDGNGGKAVVTAADMMESNGVMFSVDAVLMPKAE